MTKIASHMIEIFQRHRAFAETERFFHSGAARLMTHVRAVGQIVCPELAHEELIKKRRFVAGAAGGVEDRFVRRSERIQFAARSARKRPAN